MQSLTKRDADLTSPIHRAPYLVGSYILETSSEPPGACVSRTSISAQKDKRNHQEFIKSSWKASKWDEGECVLGEGPTKGCRVEGMVKVDGTVLGQSLAVQGPPLTTCTALIVFEELKLSACG